MTLLNLTRPTSFWTRSPLSAVTRLQEDLQRLFEGPASPLVGSPFFNVWAPALDVYEDKENLLVKLEVPGMKREDFEIGLHDGVLSIAGERRVDEKRQNATGYRTERFTGRFQRSVTLPKAVEGDRVKASYKDGILTITLPVAAEARPKQIAVSAE